MVPPTTASQDDPRICLPLNRDWLPYVLGALQQLCPPSTWITADNIATEDILGRVQELLSAWGAAGECNQLGTQSITITAGNASATHTVTFPSAFTSAPVAVVSESSGDLIASVDGTTATTVTLRITSNVVVITDTTATVSWIAGPAS